MPTDTGGPPSASTASDPPAPAAAPWTPPAPTQAPSERTWWPETSTPRKMVGRPSTRLLKWAGIVTCLGVVGLIAIGALVPEDYGCRQASEALIQNINAGMDDPSRAIDTAYVSDARNLVGPPLVTILKDPLWVAARVPGSDSPALWLAEKAGDGFALVANDRARSVNIAGRELGGPRLDGDGQDGALRCLASGG